jgi:hypothetical protein
VTADEKATVLSDANASRRRGMCQRTHHLEAQSGAEGILSLDTDESISHLEEMLGRLFGRSMPDSEH